MNHYALHDTVAKGGIAHDTKQQAAAFFRDPSFRHSCMLCVAVPGFTRDDKRGVTLAVKTQFE
jgi:hypothetical protein